MIEKITSLLLVCVVALSIICACSSFLSSHPAPSVEAISSGPSTVIEKPWRNSKLPIQEIRLHITGDPIDDPTPN